MTIKKPEKHARNYIHGTFLSKAVSYFFIICEGLNVGGDD